MMSIDYKYGPKMNFQPHAQVQSAVTTSDYLDVNGFNLTQSKSIDSQQSHLGSHWKKINPSIQSAPYTLMSQTDTLAGPSLRSLKYSNTDGLSSLSSDSSSTIHGNPAVSLSKLSDSLRQSTEGREDGHCLQLQMAGLQELQPIIKEFTNQLEALSLQQVNIFFENFQSWDKMFHNLERNIEYMNASVEDTIENYESSTEDFADLTRGVLHRKESVEKFVRKTENSPHEDTCVLNKMRDSLQLLATIRQNLKGSTPDTASMTSFGQEDLRLRAVFYNFVEMVEKLPLDEHERHDFNCVIKKIEKDLTFENRAKCELIIRHLMTVMSRWENNKSTSSSFDTANWNSIDLISSTSHAMKNSSEKSHSLMESSSFELTDDSNLNDLEGALRSSAMRVAVEGPHQVYECSPWDTSSILSGDSSDGRTSIHSLNTPMTLSSYVMSTSTGQSTCSSLSKSSMPTFEEAHQSLIKSASRSSVKPASVETAFSSSDPIHSLPPRSFDEKSLIQSATGTRTTIETLPSLNFSTASLSEMVEDALHTAKDTGELINF